jgi:L-serine dehydratase
MALSVFDLFSVGIGPSSSHTVGPMRAARLFVSGLASDGLLGSVGRVHVELFGSLGATGHGHGSPRAVVLGLLGETPEDVDPAACDDIVAEVRGTGQLSLLGQREIGFDLDVDLVMHRRKSLPLHPNGMTFEAFDAGGESVRLRTYYSVGGGFVLDESAAERDRLIPDDTVLPFPFETSADLMGHCEATGRSVDSLLMENEQHWRSAEEVHAGLLRLWDVMQECVATGTAHEGVLPGGLKVRRRAPNLARALAAEEGSVDPMRTPPAAGSSPRRRTARPASFRRFCTTTRGSSPAPTATASYGSCSPPARSA